MTGWAVLFFALAALCVPLVVMPRATWRLTGHWMFKDPDAVELKDWMYTLGAACAAVLALIHLGVGIWLLVDGDELECRRILSDVRDAGTGLEISTSGLGELEARVEMQRVARDLGVEVIDHDSWFEVVDEDGEVLGTIDENGVHSRC
jgi:hypothetical protein